MSQYKNELQNLISFHPIETNINNLENKDIILYGAGSMGEMALNFFKYINLLPKYFVDKNRKGELNNVKILKPENLTKNEKENSLFIICIVTCSYNSIYLELSKLKLKHIVHFYNFSNTFFSNLLSNGWDKFKFDAIDINHIEKVLCNLRHNKTSIYHYLQFLWWRLKKVEKIYKNFPVLSGKKYFDAPCFPKLNKNERFLDVGAHHGTTIKFFLESVKNDFDNIWAFEPDKINLKVLNNSLDTKIKNKISIYDIALSNIETTYNFIENLGFASKLDEKGTYKVKVKKIDSLGLNPTIIKLHIEGSELQALEGAKETIKLNRPIIMVLADHNEDGLYKIANFLIALNDYLLYFYLHDYCGNSAIYYAIPKERIKNE